MPAQAGTAADLAGDDQSIPQLPESVLERILLLVPLSIRLGTCAGVCKAWAAAAVRVTSSLQFAMQGDEGVQRFPQLQSWLIQSEQQLTSLQISQRDDRVAGFGWLRDIGIGTLQLPCCNLGQLQELSLEYLRLELVDGAAGAGAASAWLPSSSGTAGAAAAAPNASTAHGAGVAYPMTRPLLPALQRLRLHHCYLHSPTGPGLVQLAQSPVLTSLQLCSVGVGDDALNSELATVLEQLPGLQVLEVQDSRLYPATMRSITAMQKLQDLTMGFYAVGLRNQAPAALPHGLTRLEVAIAETADDNRTDTGVPEAEYPEDPLFDAFPRPVCLNSLPNLHLLQELKLSNCWVDADVLGRLTTLRKLHLHQCDLWGFLDWPPARTSGTLPRALLRLTRLQALTLSNQMGFVWDDYRGPLVPPELCSAITASAQLTRLELNNVKLPRSAVRFMLPAGSCKPQLRVLRFKREYDCSSDVYRQDDPDTDDFPLCLDDRDLLCIAHACSGLHTLELSRCVLPGSSLSWLQQLPESLSSLSVGGQAIDDAAAIKSARLSQRRALSWIEPMPKFSTNGFKCLTALTGLTALYCQPYYCELYDLFISTGVSNAGGEWSACASAQKGPVWQQVQAVYDKLADTQKRLAETKKRLAQEERQRAAGRQVLLMMAARACQKPFEEALEQSLAK